MTSAKPPRRTQEDRSASTRAKLLKAAIHSLYAHGYAATTTTAVATGARVSRGAMLHQFPTRIDLMLHVVRAVYDEEIRLYHEALDPIPDPQERRLAFPRIVWEVLRRPAGVAVLEIMQGARSDAALSKALKPLQREIEKESFEQATALVGVPGKAAPPELKRLVVWALRGLSIARIVTDEPAEIDKSVDLLCRLLVMALEMDSSGPATRSTRLSKKKK